MAVNIGPKIGIDGEAEYRKQINNIITSTKTLNAEMKALKSSFDSEGKSIEQNNRQREILNQQIKLQEERVAACSKMLEESKAKFGENSSQTDKWRQALANAQTDLNNFNRELDELPSSLELVGSKMKSVGDGISNVGSKIASFGSTMTKNVTTPIVGAFTLSAKSAIDWESAFTGVMKTVDETATTSYEDLSASIMKMATETASSKEDIAGVAEAAGQLGVSADDIENFTRTMVMLGDTTNLSADEAATALARFTNITGSGNSNVDRLGSSIVALGNNFATTESEITEMATRLASAGTIVGLSETDILALAAAMSSVGIQAEAGGTAMTQTLSSINSAVDMYKDGMTEDLEFIASISGVSAQEFADQWNANPVAALQSFIEGLANVKDEGGNVSATLGKLGMEGVRQSNMLQSLALASDMLGQAVDTSSQAYEENNALVAEAEKRYQTMDAKLKQTKEQVGNLAVSFGEILLPYISQGLTIIQGLADKFMSLDQSEQEQIIKMAALAAAIGPILLGGGKLIVGIGNLISAGGTIATFMGGTLIPALTTAGTFITGTMVPALASFAAGFAPLIIAAAPWIAAGAAIVAAGVLIYKNWDEIKEKAGELGDWIGEKWDGIKTKVSETWNGLKADASSAWNTIKTSVSSKADEIKSNVSNDWAHIKSGTAEAWNYVKTSAATSTASMLSNVSTTWSSMKSSFTSGFNTLKSSASTGLSHVATTFSTKWSTIKSNMSSTWSNISSNAQIALSNLNSTISSKATTIGTTIKNGLSSGVNYVKNLPSNFASWGREMIGNLAQGIRDKVASVGSAVKSVADAISSYLHFSEPDVGPLADANSWMPDFMDQMAAGIEAGRSKIQQAMNSVATDIAAPLNSNINNTTLNYGGNSIVVNAAPGMNVEEIADAVQERINDEVEAKEHAYA